MSSGTDIWIGCAQAAVAEPACTRAPIERIPIHRRIPVMSISVAMIAN
jgi:hypothetical protein